MTAEIIAAISAASAIAAIYFGYRSSHRTSIKDIERQVVERTETNMKLDEIMRTMNDIKENMQETRKEVQVLTERVALTDAKAEKAHLRIDMLEEKVNED